MVVLPLDCVTTVIIGPREEGALVLVGLAKDGSELDDVLELGLGR
jgi:hypothetical protein